MFGLGHATKEPSPPAFPPEVAGVLKPEQLGRKVEESAPTKQRSPEDAAKRGRLKQLEAGVMAYEMSWTTGARNLAEIHRDQLYLVRYPSWEEYLAKKWKKKLRWGQAMLAAAKVAANIKGITHALSVRAALRLGRLPDQQQAACLAELVAAHGDRPSEEQVAEAVRKILHAEKPQRRRKRKCALRPVRIPTSAGVITIVLKRAGADLRQLLQEALATLPPQTHAA